MSIEREVSSGIKHVPEVRIEFAAFYQGSHRFHGRAGWECTFDPKIACKAALFRRTTPNVLTYSAQGGIGDKVIVEGEIYHALFEMSGEGEGVDLGHGKLALVEKLVCDEAAKCEK